jgi:cytochrome c oxidase subunit 2
MTLAGGAIFVLVVAATLFALAAPPAARAWLGSRSTVFIGGVAFPVVALTALLVYGLVLTGGFATPPGEAPLRIAVNGERWWWRLAYLDEAGEPAFASANEIRVPVGRPVELLLTSDNVIHSFWVPALGGKLDMIPGRENRLVVEASRPGIYRGQCAEYCGGAHALMAFDVVALDADEFDAWQAVQAAPAPAPAPSDAVLAHGRDVFLSAGCGACHGIRGIDAAGVLGPDLTHLGSRLTLAAGTLPNNRGTLAAWITQAQALKPGTLMPSFDILEPEELNALVLYLESLK